MVSIRCSFIITIRHINDKRGTKDTKGKVKLINLKQTDNAMAKNEKDKQTTAHMTQHRKLNNKPYEPHQKTRGDLRCSGRVSRSCSPCGTRRVAYMITNPVNSLIGTLDLIASL